MNAIQKSDNATRPHRRLTLAGVWLVMIVGVAGAQTASSGDHSTSATPGREAASAAATATAKPAHHRWYQLGIASWYGRFFQGKTTASGQPFDENAMTCAHRSLPLGSLLKVTNLRNQKSVVVRVNDRGPMPENRVIDLSYAAAETLGFSQRGVAPVKVELLSASSEVAQLNPPDAPLPSR
jgi:rare lipoprotein A